MSEFDAAMSVVDSVITEFEEAQNKMRDALKEHMKTLFAAFFKVHPEVKTIHWVQYTPYFNDGEECVFGVHELHFTTTHHEEIANAWGEDDAGALRESEYDFTARKWVNCGLDPVLVADMRSMSEVFSSRIDDSLMRAAFGDHSWIKAHAGGFDVEHYDHE